MTQSRAQRWQAVGEVLKPSWLCAGQAHFNVAGIICVKPWRAFVLSTLPTSTLTRPLLAPALIRRRSPKLYERRRFKRGTELSPPVSKIQPHSWWWSATSTMLHRRVSARSCASGRDLSALTNTQFRCSLPTGTTTHWTACPLPCPRHRIPTSLGRRSRRGRFTEMGSLWLL